MALISLDLLKVRTRKVLPDEGVSEYEDGGFRRVGWQLQRSFQDRGLSGENGGAQPYPIAIPLLPPRSVHVVHGCITLGRVAGIGREGTCTEELK
jgi:hypothetical protein